MICLERGPNIATLCCGAAVHLNCMCVSPLGSVVSFCGPYALGRAMWLADAPHPTCVSCREVCGAEGSSSLPQHGNYGHFYLTTFLSGAS
jgi:hypothetical protein